MLDARSLTPAAEAPPIPLVGHTPTIEFPVDALPAPIASMVEAVAEATQTDPAMAGTSALSALSACAVGRAEVEARPGWREVLSLMTATVAAPGERKSAVQSTMSMPLLVAEAELVEAGSAARLEALTQLEVAQKAADTARSKAGKSNGDPEALADAISASQMAEGITVPPVPRLVADDITPEAAASLLAEQGGRLAILSAEGGIFDTIAGRYSSNVPHLDVFLKGHAGDPLRVDRRGRDPEHVKRPALTVGVMIQPTVLTHIGRHRDFRGRGLLARFLYARPVSKVGRRKADSQPVPDQVVAEYARLIGGLARDLDAWGGDPAILTLDDESKTCLVAAMTAIEPQLGPEGDLGALADWGSKFIGAVLRIAALLHLADLGADAAIRAPIPESTFIRATKIGSYFKDQAIAAFSEMQSDEGTADALHLLQRLSTQSAETVSVRDMQRLAQRFKTRDEIDVPIGRLVDTGWLTPIEQESPTGRGRPPAPRYSIHPQTWEVLT